MPSRSNPLFLHRCITRPHDLLILSANTFSDDTQIAKTFGPTASRSTDPEPAARQDAVAQILRYASA